MKNKLTFKDRLQIKIKNQPKITSKKTLVIIFLLASIVFGSTFVYANSNNEKVKLNYSDNKLAQFTFVGDMMLGRSVKIKSELDNYESVFKDVSYLWKDSQYVSGNVESALLDNPDDFQKSDKEIHLYAETKVSNLLKNNGFTMANLANNHLGDFGRDGVMSTINAVKSAGLNYVGAGKNIDDAATYDIQEVNGIKVATLGISDIVPKDFSANRTEAGILSTKYPGYNKLVYEASQKADLVVVNLHWGVEYGVGQSEAQEKIAKSLIDAGADIIIGSHPHVLQPIQTYKDGIIFYSMGNFVFDQGWTRTKDSMVLNYYINEKGEGTFEVVPARIENGYPVPTTNKFYQKRIFATLTKDLDKSKFEVTGDTLTLKNIIKTDITKEENVDQTQEGILQQQTQPNTLQETQDNTLQETQPNTLQQTQDNTLQ